MARWTAKVFVDSTVGEITANVEASTFHGAQQQIERIYGPVQQIVNLREVRGGGGGGSAPSGGGGCGSLILFILAAVCIGAFSSGEGDKSPRQERSAAPVERIAEPYQPPAPVATEEPMFRDYPTPPPSYCVTENFEPC